MKIKTYKGKYDGEIISLALDIQSNEARINLSLQGQSDLIDISQFYQQDGEGFWITLSGEKAVGTIGLMFKEDQYAILGKFFVHKDFRSKKVGSSLYNTPLEYAKEADIQHIILDAPSVVTVSHGFYERAGFHIISMEELPIPYTYSDRDSILYMLDFWILGKAAATIHWIIALQNTHHVEAVSLLIRADEITK